MPFIAHLLDGQDPDVEFQHFAYILIDPGGQGAVADVLGLFADQRLAGFLRQETGNRIAEALGFVPFLVKDQGDSVLILFLQGNLEGETTCSVGLDRFVEDGSGGGIRHQALDLRALHGGALDDQFIGVNRFRDGLVQGDGNQGFPVSGGAEDLIGHHLFPFEHIERHEPDVFLISGNGHLQLENAGSGMGVGFETKGVGGIDPHQDADDMKPGAGYAFHREGVGVGFQRRFHGNLQGHFRNGRGDGFHCFRTAADTGVSRRFRGGRSLRRRGGFAGRGSLPEGIDDVIQVFGPLFRYIMIIGADVEDQRISPEHGARHIPAVIPGGGIAGVLQEDILFSFSGFLIVGTETVPQGTPAFPADIGFLVGLPDSLVGCMDQIGILRGIFILHDGNFQAFGRLSADVAPGLEKDAARFPVRKDFFF